MLYKEDCLSGKVPIVDDEYFPTRKHLALLWEEFTHGGWERHGVVSHGLS